jgi:hypothetical protein
LNVRGNAPKSKNLLILLIVKLMHQALMMAAYPLRHISPMANISNGTELR